MKINNVNILRTLFKCNEPISLKDLSLRMHCNEEDLSYYIDSLKENGLILVSRIPFSEELRYSPKRFENLYSASPVSKEYLYKQRMEKLTFAFTVIAAIMATLTLVATILIPFI